MDHDSKNESKVDQTIQWARESLQRRRKELLEEKKKLISSKKNHEACDSSATQTDVQAMLERGRALLAEAEAHSEILGRYATSGISDERPPRSAEIEQSSVTTQSLDQDNQPHRSGDDFMTQFLQETNRIHGNQFESDAHSKRNAPEIPVETPDWDDERGGQDRLQDQRFGENEELQELLREGEARARLDALIATVRRRGDDALKRDEMFESPTKSISNFDPSSLKAAKRAALKKAKWDEELAAAEEEAKMLTSFKALPLPGGAEVKNNLFASTQAFQGKQIGSVEQLVRRDTKYEQLNDTSSSISGTVGAFDGISIVTSRTSHEDSFSVFGHENEADKEQAKRLREEKKMKKRQLLDSVNQIIMGGIQSSIEDDSGVPCSEVSVVEDPAKLRQDIARLEAKLKQKKTQRLATLNDIVDIDLNALFDRLVSKATGDDVKHIIDRLKNQVCGSINDFQYDRMPDIQEGMLEKSKPQRKSLYSRQEEWAEQRQQKLLNARLQLEAEAMHGITGAPELSHATRSWSKAKESHDETLRRVDEEKCRKEQEREAKERAANETKQKEMEEMQRQVKSRLNSTKVEVNKEEQMKRLEMLSRPRQIREVPIKIEPREDTMYDERPSPISKSKIFLPATPKRKARPVDRGRSKSEEKPKPTRHSNPLSDKKPNEFCGKSSFAEISDKDFSKLVKRIGKNASLKVQSNVDAQVQVMAGGKEDS